MTTRICFVCLGNICRSPTAEGIFRHLVAKAGLGDAFTIESAGTGAWHVGEPPDPRSSAVARERGVELVGAARRFGPIDFDRFDLVIAMDRSNARDLRGLARGDADREKIHLLRAFDPASPAGADVGDPYYGGERGFDDVFDVCEAACEGLLGALRDHDPVVRA